MNKKVARRFTLLAIVLSLCVVILYFLPQYEDNKRNSVYPQALVVNDNYAEFHNTLFIADLHADSLLWSRDLSTQHSYGHIDLPRMQLGNMALQVFSVVTKTPRGLNYYSNDDTTDNITLLALAQRWPIATWNSLLQRAIYQSEKLHQLAGKDDFAIIRTKTDINRLISARHNKQALMGGLLSLEGAHALEGNLNNVDTLFDHGFRIIGFTHFFDNELGGSAHGIHKNGLTEFGLRVLHKMEGLGILIDISHASPAMIEDIFKHATKPVIASHTGVKGVCGQSPRNLTDAQIRMIANSAGVVGIGFWPAAVCSNYIDGIITSIKYVVDLVGVDYVALGSDFDGNVQTPLDVANISSITDALLDQGYSQQEVRKIMGGNIVKLLRNTLPD